LVAATLAVALALRPGTALTLALECESAMRVGGLVDRTLELQLRSFLAATFARAGDLGSADGQARQALTLASDFVDHEALATLYSTLSVTRQRQGQLDEAMKYAKRSLAVFEELGRARAIGQMWHNLASIHLARGQLAECEAALAEAERIATDASIPSLAARVHGLRAELAATQRRWSSRKSTPSTPSVTRLRPLRRRDARCSYTHARSQPAMRPRASFVSASRRRLPRSRESLLPARAEVHDMHAALLAHQGDWPAAYQESRRALVLLQAKLRS